MVPAETIQLRAAAVLGRVATLGTAYGLPIGPFLEQLVDVGPDLAARCWVSVPAELDRLSVSTWLGGADAAARLQRLADRADPAQPARAAQLVPDARQLRVEIESVPGEASAIALSLLLTRARRLPVDLDQLATIAGMSASALAELRAAYATLGAGEDPVALVDRVDAARAPSWTLLFRHRNDDPAQRDDTRARLRATAALVGATGAQRDLVDRVHDMLAGERPTQAGLRVAGGAFARELIVAWAQVPWEHAVRMMIGFDPRRDCARRLGALAGAAGSDEAAAVELVLGPTEPPHMRVTAQLPGEPS